MTPRSTGRALFSFLARGLREGTASNALGRSAVATISQNLGCLRSDNLAGLLAVSHRVPPFLCDVPIIHCILWCVQHKDTKYVYKNGDIEHMFYIQIAENKRNLTFPIERNSPKEPIRRLKKLYTNKKLLYFRIDVV